MNVRVCTMNSNGLHLHGCYLLFALLLILLGASANAQEMYYMPQVANGTYGGGSYRTTFVMFNPNALSADVAIYLSDASGNPLTVKIPGMGRDFSFSLRLPPGAARILQTDGAEPLATGSATFTCSAPISVSAVFSLYDPEGRFVTEAGVGNSPPGTDFSIPVDSTGSFNTGAASSS
jgi:hypothetical protein